MRLRLDADPNELVVKGDQLVAALAAAFGDVHPDLADRLHKALPEPDHGQPANPVIRELAANWRAAYEKQMQAMLKDIGKVLDNAARDVVKGGMQSDDDEPLNKSWSHKYLMRYKHGDRWVYKYKPGHEHLRQAHEMTPEETQSLHKYTGNAFHSINKAMRTGTPLTGEDAEIADHLKNVIARNRLPADGIVFRGIDISNDHPILSLEGGQLLNQPGFCSTSKTEAEAQHFGHNVMVHITYAEGDHAIDVNQHYPEGRNQRENEVLFGANTQFMVTKAETIGYVRHIHVATPLAYAKIKG